MLEQDPQAVLHKLNERTNQTGLKELQGNARGADQTRDPEPSGYWCHQAHPAPNLACQY